MNANRILKRSDASVNWYDMYLTMVKKDDLPSAVYAMPLVEIEKRGDKWSLLVEGVEIYAVKTSGAAETLKGLLNEHGHRLTLLRIRSEAQAEKYARRASFKPLR